MSAVEKGPWLQGRSGVNRMINIPLVHLHLHPWLAAVLLLVLNLSRGEGRGGLESCCSYGPGDFSASSYLPRMGRTFLSQVG